MTVCVLVAITVNSFKRIFHRRSFVVLFYWKDRFGRLVQAITQRKQLFNHTASIDVSTSYRKLTSAHRE